MKSIFYLELVVFFSSALSAGCIPVPLHYTPPAETAEREIPEQQFLGMIVAPYFHRAEVRKFTDALTDTDSGIEVVEATSLFEYAFPDQNPNSETYLHEMLAPQVRTRIAAHGVRFLVVISQTTTSETGHKDGYFVLGFHPSSNISTSLLAAVLDLETEAGPEHLKSQSEGTDSATWLMLPYAGLFIFGYIPDTEESAIRKAAASVAMIVREQVPKGSIRAAVIVGDWESAESRYKADLDRRRKEHQIESWTARAAGGSPECHLRRTRV
jgi:hypothetical protein